MSNSVTLRIKDNKEFWKFLHQFLNLNSSSGILLEIRTRRISVKIATAQNSVIKYSQILFDDVFEIMSGALPELLFVGIFELSKCCHILHDHFRNDETSIKIQYQPVTKGTVQADLAKTFMLCSERITHKIPMASLNEYTVISDDILRKQLNTDGELFRFHFPQEEVKKVRSLCKGAVEGLLLLSVDVETNNVVLASANFTYQLPLKRVNVANAKMVIHNIYLAYLDDDNYICVVVPLGVLLIKTSKINRGGVIIGSPPKETMDTSFDDPNVFLSLA